MEQPIIRTDYPRAAVSREPHPADMHSQNWRWWTQQPPAAKAYGLGFHWPELCRVVGDA